MDKQSEQLGQMEVSDGEQSKQLDNKENGQQTMEGDEPHQKHRTYMKMAKMTALRSKDPNTQVGCVIIDKDGDIVSIGYNGFPVGVDDDVFRWDKEDPEDNKHHYVVHAELNAIMNKRCALLDGCSVYVTLFPCNECAKMLIQSRIKNIFYLEYRDELSFRASKKMLDFVKIPCVQIEMPAGECFIDI